MKHSNVVLDGISFMESTQYSFVFIQQFNDIEYLKEIRDSSREMHVIFCV